MKRLVEDHLKTLEGSKSDLSILYDLSKYSENESEPKKGRLRALDKLGPDGRMNRQRLEFLELLSEPKKTFLGYIQFNACNLLKY